MIFGNTELAEIYNLLVSGAGSVYPDAYYFGQRTTAGTYVIDEDDQSIAMKYITNENLKKRKIDFRSGSSSLFKFEISGIYKIEYYFVGHAEIVNTPIGCYTFKILEGLVGTTIIQRLNIIPSRSIVINNYNWSTFLIKTYCHFEIDKFYAFTNHTDPNDASTPKIYFMRYPTYAPYALPDNLMALFRMWLIKPD